MPRYFFHVRDGTDMPDDTGTELPDDNAARTEAVVLSGGLLKDLGGDFWTGSDWLMQVVRDDGKEVCELKFSANTAEAVS
ncbi:DUF6894 family protein [Mesorhizobium sp. Root172]|jgi:hypothetical protein|uniref:DUF6894 family protein n=1 Tax=Mesorhizobium sp. Root172 TaxID=1736481 RepID=UPI0006F4D3FE|nr:hypothetical protein [Mesorhizobium sp. Root172]KRB27729.1 hypothetical protein ASE05_31770 [Mesorhizobium sp. Root172]